MCRSPQRLPSLLCLPDSALPETEVVGDGVGDTTLCNVLENYVAKGQETPSSLFFPIRTFTGQLNDDDLVVPTSDPEEVEYPYTLVPSLETRLSRRL